MPQVTKCSAISDFLVQLNYVITIVYGNALIKNAELGLSAKDVNDFQLGPMRRTQLLLYHWNLYVTIEKLHYGTTGSPDVKMS